MVNKADKNVARLRRHRRVRGKISGTAARPRLDVFRSAKHIYAQVIDDVQGVTLASASSMDKDFNAYGGNIEAAKKVGEAIAKKCLEKGITEVVYDRGGFVYHGRVKALAEGAREAGLNCKEGEDTMAMQRNRQEDDGMITKVVSINRVSKTVKGGRVMKFAALIVVGDGKGNIGYGVGKSGEVPEAIRKGEGAAKKNMRKVCLKGTTIPHEIVGEYGAGRVLMRPAAPGTGVLAGGPVRAVLECAGIKDIRAKSLRSNNHINVTAATFAGLCGLTDAESVAAKRGKTVAEILG